MEEKDVVIFKNRIRINLKHLKKEINISFSDIVKLEIDKEHGLIYFYKVYFFNSYLDDFNMKFVYYPDVIFLEKEDFLKLENMMSNF